MKCIIVEDQPPAQRILIKYIKDYGLLELVNTFTDAVQAMEYLRSNEVDLIFLDIHLPKLSGIDFLRTYKNPPAVILTTAFPDFALESYDFDVVDYLLKPFSFPRFVKAVTKVKDLHSNPKSSLTDSLFIKSGHDIVKVTIGNIQYIKSDSDYTELYYNDTKVLSSESLKHWENELRQYDFVRIHKSYLINLNTIKKVSANHVYINSETKIPIGRSYKDDFAERISK